MSPAGIALVVALDEGGVIGHNGALPWQLPADLRRFRALTLGKAVVMGRATYESIGRPLPGRHNIVLSRRAGYAPPGVQVVADWPGALAAAGGQWAMVIGGAQVFSCALDSAQRLYLTRVHTRAVGDTWFVDYRPPDWRLLAREAHGADAQHAHAYTFETYERLSPTAC